VNSSGASSGAMDGALNNTSVILLMQAGKKKFLFPGDAQWEHWEYSLQRDKKDLKNVDLYKVGHHGSLNATPKTLWKLFAKRGDRSKRAG
jgi:beta-lactamase superfamily II metal-dependent hydrolase